MTPPREPYLDDGGRTVIQDPHVGEFGTGVEHGWHAIDSDAAQGCDTHSWALCGDLVRLAGGKHQPHDPYGYPVQHNPCHACEWAFAAATGTFDAALAWLADPLAHDAAADFLNARLRDVAEAVTADA